MSEKISLDSSAYKSIYHGNTSKTRATNKPFGQGSA